MDPFGIISACRAVLGQATHVSVDIEGIGNAAREILEAEKGQGLSDARYFYMGEGEKAVAYWFVVDTLNFCFWPLKGQQRWEYSHGDQVLSGFFGMAACVKDAFMREIPLWDPRFLASLGIDEFFSIFGGNGSLLIIHQRHQNLIELGRVICEQFEGSFENIIKASRGSAIELVRLMVENFPSFNDRARYRRLEVPFFKRAQILAWDISLAFEGKGPGRLSHLDELTAFADYKLPQVLRELGVLRYGRELSDIVDKEITIPQGSPMEVEIRAGTIISVELLKAEISKRGGSLISAEIDNRLWHMGQLLPYRKRPYHKTVTIYY